MFGRDGPTFKELVKEALSSTDAGYDLLAPKFDRTPFRTPDALIEAVRPYVAAVAVDAALDVCCGTGAATRALAGISRQCVVGVDRSEGMLAEARRRLDSNPRVSFVRADALSLPFVSAFDVAVSFGAFGHILEKDEPRFCASIYDALKPGGRFVFATSTMPSAASKAWWMARSFNLAMHVRNAVLKPEFIMYYLTFLWPTVRTHLEGVGFTVEAHRLDIRLGGAEHAQPYVVVATKPRGSV